MTGFIAEDLTPEQISDAEALYGPFTQRVRDLVDAAIRTEVDPAVIREVDAELEKIVTRLQERQIEGSFGLRHDGEQVTRAWGNAVIGLRNALAPPLDVQRVGDGRVAADFRLGAAYEGPPGLVHGGIASLILDHAVGMVAGSRGKPRMTATITVDYLRPTPLGDLRVEAWIERVDGYKTYAKGHLIGPDGVTAEAQGLFIAPKWARD